MDARSPTARRMPCAATRRSSTPISVWRAHELLYRSRRRRLARGGDVLARRARLRHHLQGVGGLQFRAGLACLLRRAHLRLVDGARLERSEEHTSELQSPYDLVCRLLLEKKKNKYNEM